MKKVALVGMGMGNLDTLTMGGHSALMNAEAIIGASRLLETLERCQGEKTAETSGEKIAEIIKTSPHNSFAVALSGDVGFYSGGKKLYDLLKDCEITVYPGISTVAYFASRLGRPWQDFHCVSGHGVSCFPLGEITTHKETFFLTDKVFSPRFLCSLLVEHGLGDIPVFIGEELSYPEEKITTGVAEDFVDRDFATLSVILVENIYYEKNKTVTHGFGDSSFVRGNVPMTKEEIRSIIISKLCLKSYDVVYDVGAGTGSVAIEMALQCHYGMVYAIEKNPEGIALILENQRQLSAYNLIPILGSGGEEIPKLPPADKVFIGGSTGEMEEILKTITEKNSKVDWVATAVTLETMGELIKLGEEYAKEVEIVQIGVTAYPVRGSYHMAQSQNPIFIVTGRNSHE